MSAVGGGPIQLDAPFANARMGLGLAVSVFGARITVAKGK